VSQRPGARGRGSGTERFFERLSVVTLYVAGLYFVLVPTFLPGPLGWNLVAGQFGEVQVLAFAVGFLFLYMAVLTREKYRLRSVTLDTLEALNMLLYGPGYRRHREAVDLLVRALRSAEGEARRTALRTLREMTGQTFGDDAEAWESWWSENRSRFRLHAAKDSGPEETPAPPGDSPPRSGKGKR
jgi:hypothetical protein